MNSSLPNPQTYDQILQQHRALHELLRQIDATLKARTATIQQISDLLAHLGDCLVRHFFDEEEGGYFSEALLHAPQLIARANELMAQHPKMCDRARDLVLQLEPGLPSEDWWQQTQTRFDSFRAELLRHERGENHLIQEAYYRDLGPGD
jgi:hypothetical protein